MLRTFDLVLIGVMTAAAAVTYTIKHRAELKLEEVHRLEAEIKLEKDTIELLKADWALQSQPNRLERLVTNYNGELQLQPTESTSLVHAKELPMLKSQVPAADVADIKTGSTSKSKPTPMPVPKIVGKTTTSSDIADIILGSKPKPKLVPKVAPKPAAAEVEDEDVDQVDTGAVE